MRQSMQASRLQDRTAILYAISLLSPAGWIERRILFFHSIYDSWANRSYAHIHGYRAGGRVC